MEGRNRACDLPDRRPLYKILDHILETFGLRYIPKECEHATVAPFAPVIKDGQESIWANVYECAVSLVLHDDTLNWQKFNNMLYMNAGLIAAAAVCVQNALWELGCGFALVAIVSNWLFDFTLQEGMRCLRAHKAKVKSLDSKIAPEGQEFMFKDNPFNHREALEIAPILFVLLWIVFLGSFVRHSIGRAPESPSTQAAGALAPNRQASPAKAPSGKDSTKNNTVVTSESEGFDASTRIRMRSGRLGVKCDVDIYDSNDDAR